MPCTYIICESSIVGPMNKTDKSILMRLFRSHIVIIAFIIILHIICVTAQVLSIGVLKPLINEGVTGKDMDGIIALGYFLVFLTVIASVTIVLTSFLASKIATKVSESLRMGIMESAVRSRRIDNQIGSTANTMTCLTSDVSAVQRYVFDFLRVYLAMPFLIIILFYFSFEENTVVSVILVSSLAVVTLITYFFAKRTRVIYQPRMESMDRVNNLLREKVEGARAIRAYGGYDYEDKKFQEASARFGNNNTKIELNNYFIPHIATAIMWVFVVFVFVYVCLISEGMEMAVELIIFMQYATFILSTLSIVPYLFVEAPRARVCYNRILEVTSDVAEEPGEEPSEDRDRTYALRVSDLHRIDVFGRKALDGVSFDVKAGETVTIIGPNGCGNTALFALIFGFIEADSGTIVVDGMDTREVNSRYIRDTVAYAANSVHIFGGSLRYNLDPHGAHTDDEIMDLCRRIHLDKLVNRLPEGLDTVLTEDISSMSGGQRLLIVIARALLRDVPLYVFDNCFYSLDQDTKSCVMKTISEFCKGRSVVFVMHDTSTCAVSDTVLLMDSGRITDSGRYADLRDRSVLFREMCTEGQKEDGTWA